MLAIIHASAPPQSVKLFENLSPRLSDFIVKD